MNSQRTEENNQVVDQAANQVEEEEEVPKVPFYRNTKIYLGLLLLAFIAFIIVDTATTGYVRDIVDDFLDWIENNAVAGLFVFVLVYFLATVLFIPGSILTLGAGFVFSSSFGLGVGVFLGSLAVFLGASAGALTSFLLARYLLREQIEKLSAKYKVFQALDQALRTDGLKIFSLLRLSPIIPFNALNYIGGVTSVDFRAYALALFGILPGTILYVFLGASAGSLADSANSGSDSTVTIVVVVVGIVFGVLAVYMTTRYARRELSQILETEETKQDDDDDEENQLAPSEDTVDEANDEQASLEEDTNEVNDGYVMETVDI